MFTGIIIGSLGTAVLFVFFPDLAVIPAGLLRKAWEWVKKNVSSPKE